MAEIYAIQSGRWDDVSTWSSGTIPTADDVVSLNGYIINIAGQTATANTITNEANETTGGTGGSMRIQSQSNAVINATLKAAYSIVTPYNVDMPNLRINGDIYVNTGTQCAIDFSTNRARPTVIINGNIYITSGMVLGNSGMSNTDGASYTINGNVKEYHQQTGISTLFGLFGLYQLTPKMTINGNLDVYSQAFPTYLTGSTYAAQNMLIIVNGTYTARSNNLVINKNLFKVNKLRYSGKFPFILYWFTTDANFEIQCIDEPTTNPYTFINTTTILNTYPQESDVKTDVVYGLNSELVGTFEVDYPQEAVVLKDVVYDSGNKTGKLVVLPAELISRLLNCPTIETMQQLLIAHLNPETD